jgi:hypothetical protein
MSKCSISIDLEGGSSCRGGATIRGVVRVCAHEAVRCRGVRLEQRWETHGRGNKHRERLQTVTLYEGALPLGQVMELPFELVVPPLPLTYHGHYINIDHYLEARVDVPLWFDVKVERELLVEAGEQPEGGYDDELRERAGKRRSVPGKISALIGGAFMLGGLTMSFFATRIGIVGYLIGLGLTGLGLFVAFAGMRKHLARKALGEIDIAVPSWRVYPGAVIPLEVRLKPEKPLRLRSAVATLRGIERCVSGSGTRRTTHTHTLHETKTPLCEARSIDSGAPSVISGEIAVPEDAAFSFKAEDNDIIWELEVEIDIEGWLRWSETRKVVVRPWVIEELAGAVRRGGPAPSSEPAPAAFGERLDSQQLEATAARLRALGPGDERHALLAQLGHREAQFLAVVSRVEPTAGSDVGEAYERGRTLIGEIAGSRCGVAIRFPRAHSDSIAMVSRGITLEIRGRIAGFSDTRALVEIDANGARIAPRAPAPALVS